MDRFIKKNFILIGTLLIIGWAVASAVYLLINNPEPKEQAKPASKVEVVKEVESPVSKTVESEPEEVAKVEPREVIVAQPVVVAPEPVQVNTLVQPDSFWLVANTELEAIGYNIHRREAHLLAGYMTRHLGDQPLEEAVLKQRARECAQASQAVANDNLSHILFMQSLLNEPCWTS